jgi:hypothetical protein
MWPASCHCSRPGEVIQCHNDEAEGEAGSPASPHAFIGLPSITLLQWFVSVDRAVLQPMKINILSL